MGAIIAYHEKTDTTISHANNYLIVQTPGTQAWTSKKQFQNLAKLVRTHRFSNDGSMFAWSGDYHVYLANLKTNKITEHALDKQCASLAFFNDKLIFTKRSATSINGKNFPIACNTVDLCGESNKMNVCGDILVIQCNNTRTNRDGELVVHNLTAHRTFYLYIPGQNRGYSK